MSSRAAAWPLLLLVLLLGLGSSSNICRVSGSAAGEGSSAGRSLQKWKKIVSNPGVSSSQSNPPSLDSNRVLDATLGSTATCLFHASNTTVPQHTWLSNPYTRRMAVVNLGMRSRLRVALDRYRKLGPGENFTLTFIGGSITAGQGASDGKAFPWWAEEMLQASMGPQVRIRNAAVPGTLSSYMSVCHNVHVPKESDIIFVEYSVNDDYTTTPPMDNPVRRPFERLLRKLLNYPRRPAIVLIHSFVWHRINIPSGIYWPSSERDFHEFAMYYGIPELSVKAAAWRLMKEGAHGFMVDQMRGNHIGATRPPDEDKALKGRVFYWDVFHPDGQTGHKFMAEITVQAVLDTLEGVDKEPVTAFERAQAVEELPPPMIPNNWESVSDKCFVGLGFRSIVVDHAGWEFKDEGKDPGKPKLGFIAHQPGSVLTMKINTMSASENKDTLMTVELSYLKSYVHMGKASITCTSGCTCEPSIIDGHNDLKNSQLHLHEWKASQHNDCVVAVQVLDETSTGQHKVKIAGIMISQEEGIKNHMAVQMVMEGANKDAKGGTFDIREWAKQDPVPFPSTL